MADMKNPDVRPEVKIQILTQELQMWKNTRYQLEVRARVGRRADNKQYEESAMKELEQTEKIIDALQEEIDNVVAESTTQPMKKSKHGQQTPGPRTTAGAD